MEAAERIKSTAGDAAAGIGIGDFAARSQSLLSVAPGSPAMAGAVVISGRVLW